MWICLLLAGAIPAREACGFPIARIEFSGNRHIISSQLLEVLQSSTDPSRVSTFRRDYSNRSELLLGVQHTRDEIVRIYTTRGFLYAKIDTADLSLLVPTDSAQGFVLKIAIVEGPLFTIRAIHWSGLHQFDSTMVQSWMQTQPGMTLDESALESDLDEVLHHYELEGKPLTQIQIESITPIAASEEEGALDIRLRVDEGPHVRIGAVRVEGNTSTKAEVIIRELGLTYGKPYDASVLRSARERVERLGYFESVSDPELELHQDSVVDLVVRVREASTSSIDGVLGYNPPKVSTESGYISGLLNVGFRNISGTGRNASLFYSRETQESQALELRYLEPWILGYPINLGLGFQQRQQDTTYTRSSASLDLSLAISYSVRLIASAAYDRVIPTDLPTLPFTTYDSKSITTGLSASFDSRDNTIAPRSGLVGLLGTSYAVKSIYGPARFVDSTTPASIGIHTLILDASIYHRLFNDRIIGVVGLHARSETPFGGDLDVSDLFRLGGFSSLRGYRESELLASRVAYSNIEIRFMMSKFSFLSAFVDGAYLVKDVTKGDPVEQVIYPLSYGLGTQVESPIGVIAVSIGVPRGESLDQAKLHFGLVKQF